MIDKSELSPTMQQALEELREEYGEQAVKMEMENAVTTKLRELYGMQNQNR